jgi:hypothetical protein
VNTAWAPAVDRAGSGIVSTLRSCVNATFWPPLVTLVTVMPVPPTALAGSSAILSTPSFVKRRSTVASPLISAAFSFSSRRKM